MPKPRAKCGTQAGYASHYYHREKPCEACRRAQAEYKRAWDQRRTTSEGVAG